GPPGAAGGLVARPRPARLPERLSIPEALGRTGACLDGGPRYGPPYPPTARRAAAKPWRASIPPNARRAAAKPWRASIPPNARRAPAKPWRASIPPTLGSAPAKRGAPRSPQRSEAPRQSVARL